MEAECKLSIREFFSKDKYFYVPTYQRGYKWGVPCLKNQRSVLSLFC